MEKKQKVQKDLSDDQVVEEVAKLVGRTDDWYLDHTPTSKLTLFQRRIKEIRSTERLTMDDYNIVIR